MARRAVPLLGLFLCRFRASSAVDWQYAPSPACTADSSTICGAQQWGTQFPDCKQVGTQSPIDADFSHAVEHGSAVVQDLTLAKHGECHTAEHLVNEHTSEVSVHHTCAGKFHATWLTEEYHLHQFHWHTPSEHTVDGKYWPLEVHYVHKAESFLAHEQYLVISVLIGVAEDLQHVAEADLEAADFFGTAQDSMPSPPGGDAVDLPVNWTDFGPYDFIPELHDGFYTYAGSFTTPPCTTGVRWIISPTPRYVTQSMLDTYRNVIKDGSQLAPFADIVGGAASNASEWAAAAWLHTDVSFPADVGANTRPIQALGTERKLFHVVKHGISLQEHRGPYMSSGSIPDDLVTWILIVILACCCCCMWAVYFLVGSMEKENSHHAQHDEDDTDYETGE